MGQKCFGRLPNVSNGSEIGWEAQKWFGRLPNAPNVPEMVWVEILVQAV